jgi:hypothetical protein
VTDSKPDAAGTARELAGALDRMATRLGVVQQTSEERTAELRVYGRKNRRLIYLTLASLCLDIALTIVLGINVAVVHGNTAAIARTSASNLALCQSSNVARHQQVELWDFVLSIGKRPETARQKRTIAEFRHHLLVIYAARNCTHLHSPASPPPPSPAISSMARGR